MMNSKALRRMGCVGAAGLLGALGLIVAFLASADSQELPPLVRQRFEAARQRWQRAGPEDYDMEIVVSGAQAATYRVAVRDREVRSLTRNGHPLKQRRTLGTWTVPGMFATIQTDLDSVERSRAEAPAGDSLQLHLRATFHPQYGFPSRYQRIERRRWGANPDVYWEVTEFDVAPSMLDPAP